MQRVFALYIIKRPRTLNLPVFAYNMAIQKEISIVEPLTEKKQIPTYTSQNPSHIKHFETSQRKRIGNRTGIASSP